MALGVGCDSNLPDGASDEPNVHGPGLETALFGAENPFGQPPEADEEAAPPAAIAETVVAMAHDVTFWNDSIEGRAIVDVVAIGDDIIVAATLRDGFRLKAMTRPRGTTPAAPRGEIVHTSFEAGPPRLAVLSNPPPAGPFGVVAWLQDGVLLAQALSFGANGLEAGETRVVFMATETHEIISDPIVIESHPDAVEPWFICARENIRGMVCAAMNAAGEVDDWQALAGLKQHAPRALAAVGEGYVGVAAACRTPNDCSSEQLVTLHLDRNGKLPRRKGIRGLAAVQTRRPLIAMAAEGGLIVAGRRRNAQFVSAWFIGHGGARELDGRFERLLGGVRLVAATQAEGETWLLEESPLTMRGGFPVGLVRPRRWSPTHGREEPLAWPTHVQDALPGQPGLGLVARGSVIILPQPARTGAIAMSLLHLAPNGEAPAPPKPVGRDGRRRR